MTTYSKTEKQVLTRLQRGIEPVARPFRGLEIPEDDVVSLLKRAQKEGLVRRFGGVFDARRLGYRSILCALDVTEDQLEEKAARVSAHNGVTHCYERTPYSGEGNYPKLWFTLAMLHNEFEKGLAELEKALSPPLRSGATEDSILYELPAIRRFKIDVVFDLHTRNRDETFPVAASPVTDDESFKVYTEAEKELVRALDQQLPVTARPFTAVGEQIGQSEEWVLSTLKTWAELGALRRIGAILYHRKAGFKANAMCVWPVAENNITEAGRKVAARAEVTHCYQRPRLDAFPFDLYAMVHKDNWDETERLFYEISERCGLSGGELFASGREFKKTSMKYFR